MSTTAAKIDPLQVFMQAMGLGSKPSSLNKLSAQNASQFNAFFTGLPKPLQTAITNRVGITPEQERANTVADLAVKNDQQATANRLALEHEAAKLPLSAQANDIRTKAYGDRVGVTTAATTSVMDRAQAGINRQSDYDQAATMEALGLDKERIALVREQMEADRSRANLDRMLGGIIGAAALFV